MRDLINNMRIFLLTFFLFVFGCTNYFAEQEKIKLKKQEAKIIEQRAEDKSTCSYYGFKEDTAGYTDCLMNLDLARKQAILTRKMLECEAVRRDNNQSAATGFWAGVLMGARENLACD